MQMQADHAARAYRKETRETREMAKAAASTASEIKTITQANKGQSAAAVRLVSQRSENRRITERNADGVRQARGGTADLLKQAETLTGLMDSAVAARSANGRSRAR